MKRIMVTLPALNEGKTVAQVLEKIVGLNIEGAEINVLVIDDGSTDNTAQIARDLGAEVICHGHNHGVGAAFRTGLKAAIIQKADILVNIDSDGQFDPQYILDLVAPIMKGDADFVTASRFLDNTTIDMPKIKKWGNNGVAKIVSFLAEQRIKDASCGFRAYSRKAFLSLNLIGQFTYTHETILNLAFMGHRLQEISVPVRGEREFGESRVASNLFKYAIQSLMIMLRCYRDYRPMATFGIPGLILTILGSLLIAIFLVWSAVQGEWYPKSAAFASAFCLTVGFIFMLIALLADMFTRLRVKMEFMMQYMDSLEIANREIVPRYKSDNNHPKK